MKFSIIIPVYNIERYIKNCVESVLKQSYKNFEIILVDDGSKDNSGLICNDLKKMSSKVKVIHQKNKGLSEARNTGIRNSSGDYLMFIDGDDYLYDLDSLKKLNNIVCKKKYDVVQYNMIHYFENNDKYVHLSQLPEIFSVNSIVDVLNSLNKSNQMSISACDKIIRSDIIKKNKIFFEPGIQSEDIDWSLKLYLKINSIYVFNCELYSYRQQRVGSITSKVTKKNMKDLYNIINYWYYYNYYDNNIRNMYFNYLSYQYLILVTKSKKNMFTKSEWNIIKNIGDEILELANSRKVNMFNKIRKFFGFSFSVIIMKFYLLLKNKGILKI